MFGNVHIRVSWQWNMKVQSGIDQVLDSIFELLKLKNGAKVATSGPLINQDWSYYYFISKYYYLYPSM